MKKIMEHTMQVIFHIYDKICYLSRVVIQAKILTYPSDGQSPEVERTINLRGLKTKFSRLKIWLSITFKIQNLSSSLFFILTFPKFENQNKMRACF